MDGLDVRLIRAIGTHAFAEQPRDPDMAKPGTLASLLGVTRNTVRARLRALERAGVIAGYQAVPNLRLLGLHMVVLHTEIADEARKDASLRELSATKGIHPLGDFLGRHLCFELYFSSEEERRGRLAAACRALGVPEAHVVQESVLPQPPRAMSGLDWRIVHLLRGDALRPLTGVARELKVSVRTVRRRYEAMVREGLLDVVARVDASRIPHAIPLGLLVHFDARDAAPVSRQVLEAFDDRNLFVHVPPDPRFGHLAMQAYATSAADMEDMRRRAVAISGVLMVQIMLAMGTPPDDAWIDAAIAMKAGAPVPAAQIPATP